jgi:hypothetical protein
MAAILLGITCHGDCFPSVFSPVHGNDEYWQPFLRGQGPAHAYAMSLHKTERAKLRERIMENLPVQADGSFSLSARAWAVRATVEK